MACNICRYYYSERYFYDKVGILITIYLGLSMNAMIYPITISLNTR